MITIEIGNKKSNISNKTLSVDLPASGYDLQDAFEKLSIQDTEDCRLEKILTDIDELDAFFNSMFPITEDIPKLNILAVMLMGLTSDELDVFSALLIKDDPHTLDEVVCIAARVDEAYLEDIYTKRELGHFLVDEGYVDIPIEARDFINYKKAAKFYLKHSNCALTPYGFVDDASEKCEFCNHCYDGEILDEVFESMCERHDMVVFDIAVTLQQKREHEPLSAVIIPLPAADDVINEALSVVGAETFKDVYLADIKSRNKFFDSKFTADTDIKLLNEFAKILINMDIDTFCKYKAVMEYNGVIGEKAHGIVPNSVLAKLIAETYLLDSYDFIPLADSKTLVHARYLQTSYGFIHCHNRHSRFAADNVIELGGM